MKWNSPHWTRTQENQKTATEENIEIPKSNKTLHYYMHIVILNSRNYEQTSFFVLNK